MSYKAFNSIRKHVEEATLADMTPAEINEVFTTLQTRLDEALEHNANQVEIIEQYRSKWLKKCDEIEQLDQRIAALEAELKQAKLEVLEDFHSWVVDIAYEGNIGGVIDFAIDDFKADRGLANTAPDKPT